MLRKKDIRCNFTVLSFLRSFMNVLWKEGRKVTSILIPRRPFLFRLQQERLYLRRAVSQERRRRARQIR